MELRGTEEELFIISRMGNMKLLEGKLIEFKILVGHSVYNIQVVYIKRMFFFYFH